MGSHSSTVCGSPVPLDFGTEGGVPFTFESDIYELGKSFLGVEEEALSSSKSRQGVRLWMGLKGPRVDVAVPSDGEE